jgi:hypothetical protein
MPKQLYLDMDGVITDFIGGVERWYGIDLSGHDHWDFTDEEVGMPMQDFWVGLTDEFWATLSLTPWGALLLSRLMKYKPIILSSPQRENAGGKQIWLRRHLGGIHKAGRYILTPQKWTVAGPGKILIDDCDQHVAEWFTHGGDSILFPRKWNALRHMDDMTHEERVEYVEHHIELCMSKM